MRLILYAVAVVDTRGGAVDRRQWDTNNRVAARSWPMASPAYCTSGVDRCLSLMQTMRVAASGQTRIAQIVRSHEQRLHRTVDDRVQGICEVATSFVERLGNGRLDVCGARSAFGWLMPSLS